MKKIIILLINVLLIIILFFSIDYLFYYNYTNKFRATNGPSIKVNHFGYIFRKNPVQYVDYKYGFRGTNNIGDGRLPQGLQYKDKPPITIFGCSFVYGFFLDNEDTFGYKLAHLLKRPVYNVAIPGYGFQHMLYQTSKFRFYDYVPVSDDVIYMVMCDHYRRMLVRSFDILDLHYPIHYSVRDGHLIIDDYNNRFLNFIRSLYIFKYINHKLVNEYIKNPKNNDKITDMALLYFVESRNNLEFHWHKKVNFTVILYDFYKIPAQNLLVEKLKKHGFNVIVVSDLTSENLASKKYLFQDNLHPKAEVWDLLTPLIIEKL